MIAEVTSAVQIIQRTAPGPPYKIASITPPILPTATRYAITEQKVSKGEMPSTEPPPVLSSFHCKRNLVMLLNEIAIHAITAPPNTSAISGVAHTQPLTVLMIVAISMSFLFPFLQVNLTEFPLFLSALLSLHLCTTIIRRICGLKIMIVILMLKCSDGGCSRGV